MRIWIINHYATIPQAVGITRHYCLARQLIARGHDVMIVAANYNHFSQTYTALTASPSKDKDGLDVHFAWIPTPSYTRNSIARLWNMFVFSWRILRKKYLSVKDPPDIIIGSSPHLFAAFSAERLARRLKAIFVMEVRDLWPQTLIDSGKFGKYHPLIKTLKWLESYLYRRAVRVISLLQGASDYLINAGVNPDRIIWLPNMIDTPTPRPTYKQTKNKFTLMYAGSHGYANDLITIVEAAKILQEKKINNKIRICLIGDGPEKKSLMQIASAYHLTCIEFLNPVPKNEIYSILSQADAFIILLKNLPVFRFGVSPNKLFDYMLMGKPVIFGINTAYNPIESAQAGISIPPSDPEILARTIERLLLTSEEDLKDMGKRGQNYVMRNHHVDRLADLLEKSLLELSASYRIS